MEKVCLLEFLSEKLKKENASLMIDLSITDDFLGQTNQELRNLNT